MNYSECIEQARKRIGNYCKACPECNGKACRNQMPGPGSKGIGDTAIRNYDKWKEILHTLFSAISVCLCSASTEGSASDARST